MTTRIGTLLVVPAAFALLAGCGAAAPDDPDSGPGSEAGTDSSTRPARAVAQGVVLHPTRTTRHRLHRRSHVVAISVDGLNPTSLRRLGRKRTPHFHWLMRHGASTLNARTAVEKTITLPNHASMLTGRRIWRSHRGHGVTMDHDPHVTVHRLAGHRVQSVFNVVHRAGGSTAMFVTKDKFALFRRSWPHSIDRYVYRHSSPVLARRVARALRHPANFTFVHLSGPDRAGHAHGFMSRAYLRAVRATDHQLGVILGALRRHSGRHHPGYLLLTADHGGGHHSHAHNQRTHLVNYRIPFLAWGPGFRAGSDLYRTDHHADRPGTRRVGYRSHPIRNGFVANVATDLLNLGPVPGSTLDRGQHLAPH